MVSASGILSRSRALTCSCSSIKLTPSTTSSLGSWAWVSGQNISSALTGRFTSAVTLLKTPGAMQSAERSSSTMPQPIRPEAPMTTAWFAHMAIRNRNL